jgi:uncharacterized protein (DUF983 family)
VTAAVAPKRSILTGLGRGLAGHCPNCGKGRLFFGYLKVRPLCDACGHDNAQYPADDAPPYFTILIVGHIVIGPALAFGFIETWPIETLLAVTLPTLSALTLGLLPRVKGAVIGAQWAAGGERGPD